MDEWCGPIKRKSTTKSITISNARAEHSVADLFDRHGKTRPCRRIFRSTIGNVPKDRWESIFESARYLALVKLDQK